MRCKLSLIKVDLVLWARNGEATLDRVLKRINMVIPSGSVDQKFIIDDASTDATRIIAWKNGWEVFKNKGRGISDGTNTALRYVQSNYFCSFEQDLLLAPNWWRDIALPFLGSNRKYGASSGMRFSSNPVGLTKLQKYVAKKYRGETELSPWLRSRSAGAFTLGKTLDNTIYNTSIMRTVGGFPKIETNAGVDTALAYRLAEFGFYWLVDYNVQSIHLRDSLMDELRHQRNYAQQILSIKREIATKGYDFPVSVSGVFFRLFTSPLTGLFMALKTKEASVTYIQPFIKLYYTWGLLETRLN